MPLPRIEPDVMITPKELATSISRALDRPPPKLHWIYLGKKVFAIFVLE